VILRTLIFALLAFAAVFGVACGGRDGGQSAPQSAIEGYKLVGPSRDGSLIIARPDGLFEFSIDSGDLNPLIPSDDASTFIYDPALSPSATQIAYVVQPPPVVAEGSYDAGLDIWIANRDGTNARRVFEHEQPNQLVRYPQWADEQTIYAIVQELETVGEVTQAVYTLSRIDIGTGEREVMLEDAVAFDISPDGGRIVYAKLQQDASETLEAIDLESGANAVELVPTSEELAPFNSPHFSPDGERIAFAAADQNMPLATLRLASLKPVKVTLDGLPQDIWMIDADGSRPQLTAELKEDVPALTWGGDGEYLYVLGANALYEINLENGAIAEIGEGVFHGQIAWAPGA
jgi:Tol biopolymer transport system component